MCKIIYNGGFKEALDGDGVQIYIFTSELDLILVFHHL